MAKTIEKQKARREGNEVTHVAFVGLAYQGKDIMFRFNTYFLEYLLWQPASKQATNDSFKQLRGIINSTELYCSY
jgi:hypothetical protein